MNAADRIAIPAATMRRASGVANSLCVVAVLATIAVCVSPQLLSGWQSMLVNCAVVFLALKHCVWLAAPRTARDATIAERFAFYALWPGFDVAAFFDRHFDHRLKLADWLAAVLKTCLAVAIIWAVLPRVMHVAPLAIGIATMLSGVLLIHCGLFHLVALAWQTAGRRVQPIMNEPLAARSLADFWGRRWNLAFRDAAALVVYRPLARRFNATLATLVTFFLSGLWHEAVISFPARGGYGLPTLYFLLQGVGMILERRCMPRNQNLLTNIAGRIATALVVLLPLPLLFHRPFAEHVMIPFLHALGAY